MKPGLTIKTVISWLLKLSGVGLAVFIYLRIDISAALASLVSPPLQIIALLLLLDAVSVLLRTCRWYLLVRKTGLAVSFSQVLNYQLIGIFLGAVTPGRLGEHLKALYLRRLAPGGAPFLMSTFVDRYLELVGFILAIVLVLAAFWDRLVEVAVQPSDYWWLPLAGLGLLFGSWLLLRPSVRLAWHVASRLGLSGLADRFGQVSGYLVQVNISTLLQGLIITLVFWAVQMVIYLVAAQGLELGLTVWQLALAAFAAVLAVLLPISFAGVGTRDAALIYVLAMFGKSHEQAVSLSLMILGLNVLVIIAGFILYQRQRLKLSDLKLGDHKAASED